MDGLYPVRTTAPCQAPSVRSGASSPSARQCGSEAPLPFHGRIHLSADDYRTRQQGGVSELFWQFDLLQAGGGKCAPDAKQKPKPLREITVSLAVPAQARGHRAARASRLCARAAHILYAFCVLPRPARACPFHRRSVHRAPAAALVRYVVRSRECFPS